MPKVSPLLSVECVVFAKGEQDLEVLLLSQSPHPVLPHEVVKEDETLENAARRALAPFHFGSVYLEQLYSFSNPKRNPSKRVVSVAYFALIKKRELPEGARWQSVSHLPRLGLDHKEIVERAAERLRGKIRYAPIGFELLPNKFTLSQIQDVYETVLHRPVDKRNFRKKLLSLPFIAPHEEFETGVRHRAARLYSFDRSRFSEMKKRGFNFEL